MYCSFSLFRYVENKPGCVPDRKLSSTIVCTTSLCRCNNFNIMYWVGRFWRSAWHFSKMASKGCLLLIVGFACLWCHVVGQLTWHVIGNSTDDPYWPAPRRDAAIGYNGVRNQLILFGGRGFQTSDGPVLKDTWIYEISLGMCAISRRI